MSIKRGLKKFWPTLIHLFYIAETSSGEPVGQVRFEQNGQELLISVGLAPAYRGCGLGSRLIEKASRRAMS